MLHSHQIRNRVLKLALTLLVLEGIVRSLLLEVVVISVFLEESLLGGFVVLGLKVVILLLLLMLLLINRGQVDRDGVLLRLSSRQGLKFLHDLAARFLLGLLLARQFTGQLLLHLGEGRLALDLACEFLFHFAELALGHGTDASLGEDCFSHSLISQLLGKIGLQVHRFALLIQ